MEGYRKGERPSLSEYTEKHPELTSQIRELLPALIAMEELGSAQGHGDEARQLPLDSQRRGGFDENI